MDSRIASAFARGVILPSDPEQSDLVHLTRALATLAGVSRFAPASRPVQRILDCVGSPQHVIFILLDGMGMNLMARLAPSSFPAVELEDGFACNLTVDDRMCLDEYCYR
ncbi:MAG: hypothetical protein QM784_38180 [Polyangiaceae bacterium]